MKIKNEYLIKKQIKNIQSIFNNLFKNKLKSEITLEDFVNIRDLINEDIDEELMKWYDTNNYHLNDFININKKDINGHYTELVKIIINLSKTDIKNIVNNTIKEIKKIGVIKKTDKKR